MFLRIVICPIVVLLFQQSSHSLFAHNPPEEYYDRRITVALEPACVRVHYHLELSQISLFSLPDRDRRIDTSKVKNRATLEAAILERFKVLLPNDLVVFLNDKELPWTFEKPPRVDPLDSTHFHLHLRADWKPQVGLNRFELSDKSFPKVPGPYSLKIVVASDEFAVEEVVEPRDWTMKTADPREERTALVVFRASSAVVEQPPEPTALPEEASPASQTSLWQRLWKNDLLALLSTDYGLGLLMLIALVHGAGHSLMPGHGKTMVAAYLVGERGTPGHAVTLGIVTTLTHTSAAVIVALLLRYVLPPDSEKSVNAVLMFACGLTMLAVGIWLFLQRLAGQSDHVHLFDLSHSHGGEPAVHHSANSTVRLILLGIAGGIIPCWGAIMWVVGCIATGQFWLALPVVLAFSIGLSMVLIAIGLSVVYAGRLGDTRIGRSHWFKSIFTERVVRIMPVVGAGVIILIGLFFCASSGIAGK